MFLYYFVLALALSALLTRLLIRFARRRGIVDRPEAAERKIHTTPIPLLGGVAVIVCVVVLGSLALMQGALLDGVITQSQVLGFLIASIVLAVGGVLDDMYNLSPKYQILFPIAAAAIAVGSGIQIAYATNPFAAGTGPFGRSLVYFTESLFGAVSIGGVITFIWLLVMMYATKLLDGLDGLVTGVGVIGSAILFVVSLFWDVPQSGTSLLSVILAGACLGFLVFNWHPARIFLGEAGSLYIGFTLGVISVISGAKIATTLLIMGIPILDVVWVMFRRLFKDKKNPFLSGDNKHLHFALLRAGASHKQSVLILYGLTATFGASAIFLQSTQKIVALGILILTTGLLMAALLHIHKKKNL